MEIKAPTVGAQSVPRTERTSRVRFMILAMLFIVTTINYADRATISMAGSAMQKDLGIDAVSLGYIFSAFGWAYVIAQIPGGWLLDRFGSRRVYSFSILLWSLFTLMQGTIGFSPAWRPSCWCSSCASWWRGGGAVLPGQQPHRRGVVPGQ